MVAVDGRSIARGQAKVSVSLVTGAARDGCVSAVRAVAVTTADGRIVAGSSIIQTTS